MPIRRMLSPFGRHKGTRTQHMHMLQPAHAASSCKHMHVHGLEEPHADHARVHNLLARTCMDMHVLAGVRMSELDGLAAAADGSAGRSWSRPRGQLMKPRTSVCVRDQPYKYGRGRSVCAAAQLIS